MDKYEMRQAMEVKVTVKVMFNDNPMAMLRGHDASNDTFTQVNGDWVDVARADGNMEAWYLDYCERAFKVFNLEIGDSLPRSMCVGDRVVFEFGDGSVTYECKDEGWEVVS
jgi:hypothetical protein